jgi:hypothetical protein
MPRHILITGGQQAALSSPDSASDLLQAIEAGNLDLSGHFLDWRGHALPW